MSKTTSKNKNKQAKTIDKMKTDKNIKNETTTATKKQQTNKIQ